MVSDKSLCPNDLVTIGAPCEHILTTIENNWSRAPISFQNGLKFVPKLEHSALFANFKMLSRHLSETVKDFSRLPQCIIASMPP